jgi:hypothetical protein
MIIDNAEKIAALKKLLTEHSKPDLAKKEGMVYQVWEDGEVSLQKSGQILWQRTLFTIERGFERRFSGELFPHHLTAVNRADRHGYIFTDETGAMAVRNFIKEAGHA